MKLDSEALYVVLDHKLDRLLLGTRRFLLSHASVGRSHVPLHCLPVRGDLPARALRPGGTVRHSLAIVPSHQMTISQWKKTILKTLGYQITVSSAHAFLVRYLKAGHADKKIVQLWCYFMDETIHSFTQSFNIFHPS